MSANLLGLRAGEYAVVDGIRAGERAAKRLADLGFIRGAQLEMLCAGAPCIVRVEGTCVGLGRPYQQSILVGSREPVGA